MVSCSGEVSTVVIFTYNLDWQEAFSFLFLEGAYSRLSLSLPKNDCWSAGDLLDQPYDALKDQMIMR